MPLICSNCSTRSKGPYFPWKSTIKAAVFVPTPSNSINSTAVAELSEIGPCRSIATSSGGGGKTEQSLLLLSIEHGKYLPKPH